MIITKRNLPQTLFVISASTAAKLVTAAMLENDTVDSIQTNQISEVDSTASAAATDMDSTAMHQPEETNDDDDGFFYIPHETDSTLSATFSIRVTPEHYYVVSWMILWLCFVVAVVLGLHQIRLERKWLKHVTTSGEASKSGGGNNSGSTNSLTSYRRTRQQLPGSSPSDPELGKTTSYTKAGGRLVRSNRSRDRMIMARSTSSTSVNSNLNQNKQQNSDSSSSSVLSSGDVARATVSTKIHCGALYYFPFWHPTKKVLMKVRSSHNLFVLLPSSSLSETLLTILTFTKYTHTVP